MSADTWTDWSFAGPLVASPFQLGTPHQAVLDPLAKEHYCWIGAGAFRQENSADDWYVQGSLQFISKGRPVGSLIFSDASVGAAAVFTGPVRSIMRIRADGAGSVMPVLRMQVASNPAWVRDNLDIGCFRIPVQADRVEYVVEDGRVSVAVGRIVLIRTGFRILSL